MTLDRFARASWLRVAGRRSRRCQSAVAGGGAVGRSRPPTRRCAMVADEGRGLRATGRAGVGRRGRDWSAGTRLSRPLVRHRERRLEGRRCPGSGNSSPIVWGDRIILTTAYDDGTPSVGAGAIAAATARSCGRPPAPQGRTDDGSHYKNGHASATPATDGQRIYVLVRQPRAAGARHGRQASSGTATSGAIENYHGPAGSPLLYKDRVILYQDQSRGLVRGGLRHAHRQAGVAHAARRQRRLGHADRRARRRSRRDHRQQPAAPCRPTTRTPGRSCGAAAA